MFSKCSECRAGTGGTNQTTATTTKKSPVPTWVVSGTEQRGRRATWRAETARSVAWLALSPALCLSLSFPLSLSLPLSVFFFFYRECILSESIKTAPGSSVFADSCGATQLKEVLVSSAPRGRSLALARRGQAPQRRETATQTRSRTSPPAPPPAPPLTGRGAGGRPGRRAAGRVGEAAGGGGPGGPRQGIRALAL